MDDRLSRHAYQTSIDRVGWSIVVGGLLCGTLASALLVAGGTLTVLAIVMTALVGSLLAALAITAVAVPIWLVMHLTGRRRAHHAMLVGTVTGFVIFAAAQTHGFGLGDGPPSDMATMIFRWASAAATSLILAIIAGLIGVAMWRVAYRRVR